MYHYRNGHAHGYGAALGVAGATCVSVFVSSNAYAHLAYGTVVVCVAVGALAFCALGMAMTIVIPNADAAPAIVNAVFLPIVFISGTFFPVPSSSVLAQNAEVFPVRHFINAMFTAFDPAHQSSSGFNGTDLLIMAAWGAGAVVIASLRFRWEPNKV